MYANHQRVTNRDVQERRREGGRWLRELREKAGLSQRELAHLVNMDYYTFVSQLENGRGRVPPDSYHDCAVALGIAPRDFVKDIFKYYDPVTFEILFEE